MVLKHLVIAVSLGLALTGSAVAKTIVITEPEVRTIVAQNGYGDPILIQRDGTMWRVKSIDNTSQNEVTLFVNAEGEVLAASDVARLRITETTTTTTKTSTTPMATPTTVTEATVATTVMNAGFHNVHDIDFLESKGVWKAEADDSTGEDFELHVDATTGRIVHIEDD